MLRKTIYAVLVGGALLGLLFSACGQKKEAVVAKVGDVEITLGDFNIAHKAITVFNRPPLVTYEDCEAFLQTLIDKTILVQEAKARGFDKDPALQKEMSQLAMQQAIGALYKEVSDSSPELTVEEIRDFYQMSRASVKAAHIQVGTLAEAEEIAKRLRAGEDFAALAAQHSVDKRTSSSGGEIGEIRRGQVDPAIDRVIFSLQPGEISEPVKGSLGYHILKVAARTDANMEEFEDQKQVAAAELRSKKRTETWNAYLAGVKTGLGIEYDQENLLWLNGVLPAQGANDPSWEQKVGAEDRARPLLKCSDGSWTVGDFVDYVHTERGQQPFTTEGAALIQSIADAHFINEKNNAEAVKRGLDKTDGVIRTVERKVEERLVDVVFQELAKDAAVTDEATREEYEKQKETLTMPERVSLHVINVKDRAVAERAYQELKAGASFDDLARRYNTGKLQEKGGKLDPMTKEGLPAEMQRYAFEVLEVGQTSPVVSAPMGNAFVILKLLEKDPAHPMTLEEATPELQKALLEVEKERVLTEWLEKRKEEVGVKIFPEALNQLLEAGDMGEEAPGGEAEGQS
ncbi:MAG: hypothetical protein EHM19_09405 [Candidatus Latescibacterota bacterium]|nr:MAG: hypothetical protein EHM19_09405 [Candidatus Latescibacterota bacterium]